MAQWRLLPVALSSGRKGLKLPFFFLFFFSNNAHILLRVMSCEGVLYCLQNYARRVSSFLTTHQHKIGHSFIKCHKWLKIRLTYVSHIRNRPEAYSKGQEAQVPLILQTRHKYACKLHKIANSVSWFSGK